MPLESLLELVKTLKQRVKQHGNDLKASEALTRYALIDPLLRELGWDTSDPTVVVPEYRSGSGSADYALLCGDSPAMMVEAKKLGTPLQDSVILQVLNYCQMEGTKHFAITDGARWGIYDTHKPVPMNEKQVAAFDLMSQSPSEFCLKALALWRPSVQSGYVGVGSSPVIGGRGEDTPSVTLPPAVTLPTTQPVAVTSSPGNWLPLTSIDASNMPSQIQFPNGHRDELGFWNSIPTKAASWLVNQGFLTASNCPIMSSKQIGSRYLVHTEPVHTNGKQFANPKEVGNGIYYEANYNRASHINSTIAIINHVNQDPAQFMVHFD